MRHNAILLYLMLMLLTSCEHDSVYHQFRHIPDGGWTTKDTLSFDVEVDSTHTALYQLSIETRNRGDYPYKNLFLQVSNNAKNSAVFVTDTVRYVLADKEGHWLGMGISNLYQMAHSYKSIKLPLRKGHILFKIKPIMTDSALAGISDIGLKLSTSDPHLYGGR